MATTQSIAITTAPQTLRDTIFVSHANPEDNEFALWLTLQLAAFLSIHECICLAVQRNDSQEVSRLNTHFADLCAKVYIRYHYRRPESLGPLWTRAIYGYLETPNATARLLPAMAAAHILEDLPNAIYACPEVTKEQYDAVFDHIKRCIESVRKSRQISYQVWAELLQDVREKTPILRTTARIALAFGIAVAWIPFFLNPGVRKIRDIAWNIAEMKVKISRTP